MTGKDVLQAYRTAVIDLQELSVQLENTGHSGKPRSAAGMNLDALPGTNNPAAATSSNAPNNAASFFPLLISFSLYGPASAPTAAYRKCP